MYNNLNESISLQEKSAKKLLPIYEELLKKMVRLENISQFVFKGEEPAEAQDKNEESV